MGTGGQTKKTSAAAPNGLPLADTPKAVKGKHFQKNSQKPRGFSAAQAYVQPPYHTFCQLPAELYLHFTPRRAKAALVPTRWLRETFALGLERRCSR
jgi:hypothetical protein